MDTIIAPAMHMTTHLNLVIFLYLELSVEFVDVTPVGPHGAAGMTDRHYAMAFGR